MIREENIRLTALAACAGCAAKLPPAALSEVLGPLQNTFNPADYPDLLVGIGAPDDAAVYKLAEDRALIFTTDFFTPIVDDPYNYGAIAATNALSDVFAMGGKPALALNIAAFPANLPLGLLSEILRGSAEKVKEAGAVIAGGHTIKDDEPKVGLAVIGFVDPRKMFTKGGAQAGDLLILTKPLGTGTIVTASKNDKASPDHLQGAIRSMTRLNSAASEAAAQAGAKAVTDVTGFGLMGHASEMAKPAGVTFQIRASDVPLLEGAMDYALQWIFPGGSADNKKHFEPGVSFDEGVNKETQMLLFDAQTSGGLLMAIPPQGMDPFAGAMEKQQAPFWQIGQVVNRGESLIRVVP
jgi:selenide,water dikinase